MRVVYKYPLELQMVQTVQLPVGAEILSVLEKDGIQLYAMVDPTVEEKEDKEILIFGTGHEIPNNINMKFIGTVRDGYLVWHIFVRI